MPDIRSEMEAAFPGRVVVSLINDSAVSVLQQLCVSGHTVDVKMERSQGGFTLSLSKDGVTTRHCIVLDSRGTWRLVSTVEV